MRAVVLGVSGAAGRAVALELAQFGWDVVGTGRDASRFPATLRQMGVRFERSDRWDPDQLRETLGTAADLVVDCLCYTAEHARQLVRLEQLFGSAVVLSSKAVYADAEGRHSNSALSPVFDGPVKENQRLLEPDFSGQYNSREGYGPNKVAAEAVLLESDIPVSILRPSRIHGTGARPPREWFVVKRLLDGRRSIPLAHQGKTGNHPTAAINLARLVRVCADNPDQRILNAADPGTPTAAEIVDAISETLNIHHTVVKMPDDAPAGDGANPWDTWPPFFLDTTAAEELGYHPVGTYTQTIAENVRELASLPREQQEQLTADPYFTGRFNYAKDNAAIAHATALIEHH
jgi:nucleoside-diphosphate-sugar epimerase